jgi:hypothetical protein
VHARWHDNTFLLMSFVFINYKIQFNTSAQLHLFDIFNGKPKLLAGKKTATSCVIYFCQLEIFSHDKLTIVILKINIYSHSRDLKLRKSSS